MTRGVSLTVRDRGTVLVRELFHVESKALRGDVVEIILSSGKRAAVLQIPVEELDYIGAPETPEQLRDPGRSADDRVLARNTL